MVEAFINYLAHLPGDTTSPLYVELNQPAMLTAQNSTKVKVYDVNSSEGDTPYVRLSDQGQRQRMATFLGGSYQEKQTLTVECVALGDTAVKAVERAELLKLAVEGEVKKQQSALSGLSVRTDFGGTSSTENVSAIQIGSVDQETPVQGQRKEFTAKRTAIIEIWVYKFRKV